MPISFPGGMMPMRRIAWLSEKGGAGKSTSAINTAVGLAKLGHRTLLVDLDPQGNASMVMMEGRRVDPPTISELLLGQADAADAIRKTGVPNLDIIPADATLADANLTLAGELGRERRLRVSLETVEDDYRFVILDTPPTRSLLTINAMTYAHEVLVPVDPGLFSLAGLGQISRAVDEVRRYLDNRAVRIAGILLTRTAANNVSRDVEKQVRDAFGPLVFATTIPSSTKIEEAHSRYMSVLDHAPRSPGAKAYSALVGEIIDGIRAKDERVGDGGGGLDEADHAA
jgi:chromosome partitioning protein